MATAIPSIACLGVIGRNNNPLYIAIFPSHDPSTNTLAPLRSSLQFSLLLSSTLDIFALRAARDSTAVSGDVGLLHAVDERLAAYGFETNTGVKFVVIVDMRGRRIDASLAGSGAKGVGAVGLREGEMKPVFKAMHTAFGRLLQNPFFEPDEHTPPTGRGGKKITSRRFAEEMRRIGETWTPGVTNL